MIDLTAVLEMLRELNAFYYFIHSFVSFVTQGMKGRRTFSTPSSPYVVLLKSSRVVGKCLWFFSFLIIILSRRKVIGAEQCVGQ